MDSFRKSRKAFCSRIAEALVVSRNPGFKHVELCSIGMRSVCCC